MFTLKRVTFVSSLVVASIILLYLFPSLFGLLYCALFLAVVLDVRSRRREHAARTLNSAIRSISSHEGAIAKVAKAFARRGPLAGNCYEFARRLMAGQTPVDAATQSRLPLELSTAIAMERGGGKTPAENSKSSSQTLAQDEMASAGAGLPSYAKLIYLSITCMATWTVLTFILLMIAPTFEKLFEEFGIDYGRFQNALDVAKIALPILAFVLLLIVIFGAFRSRGHLFGIRLPRWTMLTPRVAHRRAETLRGLADAIDCNWPVNRTLRLAATISTNFADQQEITNAVSSIENGTDSATSLFRSGMIDDHQYAWLANSTPQRASQLLRDASDELVRDSIANERWIMAIVFPVLILALGATILSFSYGVFGALVSLINGLA